MPTTTNLQTLKINYLTQAQYDTALANNQINENELYFTPDDGGGGVFVAEYGTTTYNEILDALDDGKTVVAKQATSPYTGDIYYSLCTVDLSAGVIVFLSSDANGVLSQCGVIAVDDSWSSQEIDLTDSDSSLSTTVDTSTNQVVRYPIYGTNSTVPSTKNIDPTGFKYASGDGTASVDGFASMTLGNSTSSGSAHNKFGRLRLFDKGVYCADLITTSLTADRTINLPNANGTLALTSDIPSGVFLAEYGVTTYAAVLAAYQDGQTIIAKRDFDDGGDEYTYYFRLYQIDENESFHFTALSGQADSTNGPIPSILACMLTSDNNWIYGSNDIFQVNQLTAITTDGEYPVMLGSSTSTVSVNGKLNKSADLTYNPSTSKLTNAGAIQCGSIDDGYGLNDSAILSEETMELWGNILS